MLNMERNKNKRGKPFERGNQHGKGRPVGSRNKTTLALEEILEGEGEAITRKLIERAKAGDMVAIRLCMDRLYPPRREEPVLLELPKIETAHDIVSAFQTVTSALSEGKITTSQAVNVLGVLEYGRKSIETLELARRVEELEKWHEHRVA